MSCVSCVSCVGGTQGARVVEGREVGAGEGGGGAYEVEAKGTNLINGRGEGEVEGEVEGLVLAYSIKHTA